MVAESPPRLTVATAGSTANPEKPWVSLPEAAERPRACHAFCSISRERGSPRTFGRGAGEVVAAAPSPTTTARARRSNPAGAQAPPGRERGAEGVGAGPAPGSGPAAGPVG